MPYLNAGELYSFIEYVFVVLNVSIKLSRVLLGDNAFSVPFFKIDKAISFDGTVTRNNFV